MKIVSTIKFSNIVMVKFISKKQFSVRVGTMFEGSKISLQKWFAAIYLITSHKKGISSLQLHKDLGITQKTAWFMLHRVRHSLGLNNQPTGKLEGSGRLQIGVEIF